MSYRIHFYDHHHNPGKPCPAACTDTASELNNGDIYESYAVAVLDAEDVCRRVNRDEPDSDKVEVRYRILTVDPDDDL